MPLVRQILIIATLSLCSGCAAFSPRDVANPSTLTVADAMSDIGIGFANLKKGITRDDPNNKTGLWPCKVAVTLNVTANAKMGGKLVLDTSLKPPATIVDAGVTAHAEQTNSSSATRGNTITIDLYNPACIPTGTVGFDKPDKVYDLNAAMQSGLPGAPR